MRILCTVFLLLAVLQVNYAQVKSEPKTYYDSSGTLYWNKKLPVYVILSSTPDPSKGVVLKEQDVNNVREYHFDTEGINWIRSRWATDSAGQTILPKREVLWPVMADGIAPVTSATIHASGKFASGSKAFYSGDATVHLQSADAVSGVETIYYSTGSGFQEYNGPFALPGNRRVNLRFYGVDHVGNAENGDAPRNILEFYIDATAPASTLELIGPHVDNILSPKTKIKLLSTDESSGVSSIQYGFNGSANTVYQNALSLNNLKANDNSLTYHASDRVKNKEEDKTFEFFLDAAAPALEFSVDKDYFKSAAGNHYVSLRSAITLNATDNKAGVNAIYFSVDGVAKGTYTSPLNTNQKPGLHKLIYAADDRVENMSKDYLLNYFVDAASPKISYHVQGPKLLRNDTLFIRTVSKIVLAATDLGVGESGVKQLTYKIGSAVPTEYSASFSVEGDGVRDLSIQAVDQVNNGAAVGRTLFVDNVAPVIVEVFSVDKIGSKVVKDQSYTIYPKEMQLYLAAKDKSVGTQIIYYSINGMPRQIYTKPIKGLGAGNYSIAVRAIDILGNESSKTITFSVE
ncbi:MAG TPA: hypothetical protein VIN08_01620 [Ohtaekwangia sp.]|uniref:OmpL47-type beta-barrel domain-containing protein n=1 Tax=Ohtaekwangia sp. TaxID=2066019 RepID=UPI002F930901